VPPANEDSFPGLMPNVIPARVASFFDLKGLTLACDAGFASALVAFELGARYLHSGELDLAIVGGINGNSGWEASDTLRGLGLPQQAAAGEGAFLFALMRESTARERGMPVLAYVDTVAHSGKAATAVDCGVSAAGERERLNYMGADSAWAVLRALHSAADSIVVRCHNGADGGDRSLYLERPTQSRDQSPRPVSSEKVASAAHNANKTAQIRFSHPTLGPDGWIYLTSGLNGGRVTSPAHPERPPVEFSSSDSRMRRRASASSPWSAW